MGWLPSSARAWRWLWLYPATLAIHMFEEKQGGAQFYEWVDRPPGAELTSGEFLGLTSFALAGMVALTLAMLRWDAVRFLAVSVAVAFFLNSISHTINSVIAGGYTPGLVTGIVIWWPLVWFALRRCRTVLPKERFRLGLWIGAGIQLGVMATTLLFTVVV